ncbi:sulfotransferase family protein [Treponema denticola]|uniref:sulfotransferase family protein n=1 Tax=Treponema denticola TaxID=158 RepID=UPI0020A347CB|nr:sulfotransferase family protein [Treponema denticola]UTD07650.1 sulfotransferase family protein [Treponema denticola]
MNFPSSPIIIGTSSFAQSGGSAITNILEEFSNFSVLRGGATFECKFFTENIFALETALKIGNGIDKAVKTFLYNAQKASKEFDYKNNFGPEFLNYTIEYIDSVTEHYLGAVHKDYDYAFLDPAEHAIFSKAQKLYNYKYGKRVYEAYEPYPWVPTYAPFGIVYYGDFPNDFYDKTHEYIEKVFAPLYEKNKRYVLADALYSASVITPRELMYYKNSKVLIANRDPRDLYVMNKEIYGEWYMPTWNVDRWIEYYRYKRQCIKPQKENNAGNILHLQFESLIYNYEGSLAKIKKFLDLKDSEHIKKGQIFIPEKSKTNTQLFRKYPKYAKDIEKIEKELPEFCYPYSETQIRHFLPEEIKGENRETLEDIRKTVCIFQKTGKLPFSNKQGAFLFSKLGELIQNFKDRKTIFSKIKGIIKLILFFPYYLADFYKQLKFLNEYQTKNKDKVVEFK